MLLQITDNKIINSIQFYIYIYIYIKREFRHLNNKMSSMKNGDLFMCYLK